MFGKGAAFRRADQIVVRRIVFVDERNVVDIVSVGEHPVKERVGRRAGSADCGRLGGAEQQAWPHRWAARYCATTGRLSPKAITRPSCSHSARLQNDSAKSMSCVATRNVRTAFLGSSKKARHFARNLTSPADSASSMRKMSVSMYRTMENPSLARVPVDRVFSLAWS